MKHLVLVGTLLLAGCGTIAKGPVGQLTLADAQTASAMAKQGGDEAGQKCYDYIAAQIQSQTTSGTCGLLCANEAARTAVTAKTNLGQACGGVLPLVLGL